MNTACRIDDAVEALRKARATDECRTSLYGMQPDCTLVNGAAFDEISVAYVAVGTDARDVNHRVQASALLDGFSVDEITAAEEALA